MKTRWMASLIVLAGSLMICCAAVAHHGGAAWDRTVTLTLKATVTDLAFANPHIQLSIDAPDENGKVVHWVCEGGSPAGLTRRGWSHNIVKPGDQVTIVGNPAKHGLKVMALNKLILADGQELPGSASNDPNN